MQMELCLKEGKVEDQKRKWGKPELVVLAKGKLGENVLTTCGSPRFDKYGNQIGVYPRSGYNG